MFITNLIIYCFSFVAIWFGAGLVITAVDRIARQLRLSSFAISFFVLGLLTSIPEIAISINAVVDHKPEIFVGTLLGGTVVIFLLIIPFLAILGRGVRINHDLSTRNLLLCLAVIAAPGLFIIDHKVTNLEGVMLVLFYFMSFYFIKRSHGIFEEKHTEVLNLKLYSFVDIAKVAAGIGIVFVSSQFIVSQTLVFAQMLNIPAFYLSLIVLSIGTNLPELS